MTVQNSYEEIKDMSIRARVALGITCLEILCTHYNFHNNDISRLIDILWEFTESQRLDIWEEKMTDANEEYADMLFYIKHQALSAEESSVPYNILLMIDLVVDIGGLELYSSISSFSQPTYDVTVKALEILKSEGLDIPDLKPFTKSKITEERGWGKPVNKSFFLKFSDFEGS